MPNPFDSLEPVSVYTADQAIEDGFLAELPNESDESAMPVIPGDPRFDLGRVVATPGVVQAVNKQTLFSLILRHQCGDWGDLDAGDKRANEDALKQGDRIVSAYQIGDDRVLIITENDRSLTTCMLPHEY